MSTVPIGWGACEENPASRSEIAMTSAGGSGSGHGFWKQSLVFWLASGSEALHAVP